MHFFDKFVLGNAVLCFLIFLMIHIMLFRFVKSYGVLKWLLRMILFGFVLNIGISLIFIFSSSPWDSKESLLKFLCLGISSILYGLLAFHYVLCIFGPYESSLRLRLIRELYRRFPEGLSEGEILAVYNAEEILKTRLERLVGSHDVVFDEHVYRLKKRFNFFMFSGFLGQKLKKLIEG